MVTIYAIDDEALALCLLVRAIEGAAPDARLRAFRRPAELLEVMNSAPCDVAFLDIDMRGMTGVDLALQLKRIHPHVNIIFVTGHSEHMISAFSMHASGYLLKPVTSAMVQQEMRNLRHVVDAARVRRVDVRTFGHFEVFVDGRPIRFARSRAKEVFAYLIDRRGAGVTAAQIATVLWEDAPYDRSKQKQVQNIIGFMIRSLKTAGIEHILVKDRNSLTVDASLFHCDYYQFLSGDPSALRAYCGEYMSNYSWAEITLATLNQKAQLN